MILEHVYLPAIDEIHINGRLLFQRNNMQQFYLGH